MKTRSVEGLFQHPRRWVLKNSIFLKMAKIWEIENAECPKTGLRLRLVLAFEVRVTGRAGLRRKPTSRPDPGQGVPA
jgi:hypothetical protein